MTSPEILEKLRADRVQLRRCGVKSIAVFGSVARGDSSDTSDIDILVEFETDARIGFFDFIDLKDHLTQLLGRTVDLATPEALHKRMRPQILREAVYAE